MIWIALYLLAILVNLKDKEMLKLSCVALFFQFTIYLPVINNSGEYVLMSFCCLLYGLMILSIKTWQIYPIILILISSMLMNLLAIKEHYEEIQLPDGLYLDCMLYLSLAELIILAFLSNRIVSTISKYFVGSELSIISDNAINKTGV
jgi:hypothetical protein